jgi:hypothetical protein
MIMRVDPRSGLRKTNEVRTNGQSRRRWEPSESASVGTWEAGEIYLSFKHKKSDLTRRTFAPLESSSDWRLETNSDINGIVHVQSCSADDLGEQFLLTP